MSDCYIGLMSGTSLDGVDGVLVDFAGDRLRVLSGASKQFSVGFRADLLALNSPSFDELERAARAANQLAAEYAEVVEQLLCQAAGVPRQHIQAIGAHGQTVRHQPQRLGQAPAQAGYSWQLNNPALLAELTGISVVADFRSRDIAAGGQGAPLVPAFHQMQFARAGQGVAVLNLGGIANLSVLSAQANQPVLGFDCGPGNVLLDAWCQRHTGRAFDDAGAWAASGQVLPDLLRALLDEPYFLAPPPKSTGRDRFNLDWLLGKLRNFASARTHDVQCTLCELTAQTCAKSVMSYARNSVSLIVCGGGAYNDFLLNRLQHGCPGISVSRSDKYGLPALQVEAAAFAWLARQAVLRQPGNLPSVTGAQGARVLGAIYPG